MLKLEVFGPGCKRCQSLEANARAAVASAGCEAEILHVSDPAEMIRRGVLTTPVLAINGKIVSRGVVLSPPEIAKLCTDALAG